MVAIHFDAEALSDYLRSFLSKVILYKSIWHYLIKYLSKMRVFELDKQSATELENGVKLPIMEQLASYQVLEAVSQLIHVMETVLVKKSRIWLLTLNFIID